MSNLPPNPFNNTPGGPQPNTLTGPQMFPPNQQFGQVPLSQLPPGYGGVKQDANSNSPLHLPSSTAQNNALHNMNNFNQSANSSPAFNQPGILPQQQTGFQSSPNRLPPKPAAVASIPNLIPPYSSANPSSVSNANSLPFPPNYNPPQRQINDNASPLMPSSQLNQPLMNGPPLGPIGPPKPQTSSPYPVTSKPFSPPPMSVRPPISGIGPGPGSVNPTLQQGTIGFTNPKPSVQQQGMLPPQPNIPFSGPPRSSPLIPGSTVSAPIFNGPSVPTSNTSGHLGQRPIGSNGPSGFPCPPPVSGFTMVGAGLPGHMSPMSGPPKMPPTGVAPLQSYPGPSKTGSGPGQPMAPPGLLGNANQVGGIPSQPPGPHPQSFQLPAGPQTFSAGPQTFPAGPQTFPPVSQTLPAGPQTLPPGSQTFPAGPQTFPTGLSGPSGQQVGPSMNVQPGPPSGPPMSGPPKSNMQNRYPSMPQGNYVTQQPQPGMGKPYPQQYTNQALTQQMGQLSVTKQGFDQLWGHQMVDLLQCKHILPDYPEDPPEIKLGHQFADAPNCSPDIFRCTINRIPETNSLLQKSRLPLGILIHPFKDLNHLPVIQCATIVRCRACRTYINPFVYFVDAKRWKCNLCYRVNDLPEEFQYDPVSKSYGDPTRRPEIKSATIEFIAPGEYMLRPPQPAVYLFLLDVSQIARESGYLQVVCDTLNANLDQLPGDARTQIGFVCYDAHVHYYLMSDDLTRPKEMTVLDIDDVFLPSPESLLVNLGERRSVVRQLLSSLPARHAAPGVPASALGAALQAAYKLMAPTGGRITVFQTCLPNVGPGALQAREDPNARSSKDVAHLTPATDFYKRLALDCSGAQVAVDLFLLNSQYADLSTLSGMSKFSAGTVYHMPLFRAARSHHAERLTRMLTRYLTRKIGFEAVMRVRCTRGIAIHTFHGNFFVRSTDLLSLPNVSPDAGFGMQLTIEESLADLQQVCFQAALLYTSSKGERRIRVHTMALPICTTLPDVLHAADQHCIVGLLAKMAVDRCVSASMSEAREALINVSVDVLSAHKLAQNLPAGALSAALHAPMSLRLLPLYLLALLKRRAFRTGTSTRLDDRVADMCDMKTLPLPQLLRAVYPELYAIDALRRHTPPPDPETEWEAAPDPPRLQLSAERINSTGAYLLDDGDTMVVYVCHAASAAFLSDTFGVAAFSQLPDEARSLPRLDSEGNALLHAFVDKLNDDRPYAADVLLLKDNSPSRQIFTERLVDDRVESAFSYYEFLQHVKSQVK